MREVLKELDEITRGIKELSFKEENLFKVFTKVKELVIGRQISQNDALVLRRKLRVILRALEILHEINQEANKKAFEVLGNQLDFKV